MKNMALSENFILYLLLFLAFYNKEIATSTAKTCPGTYWPSIGITVKFPFRLPAYQPDPRCGYPGFDLSFNNPGNAVISLPSGNFNVKYILYEKQKLWIDDPETDCLPKRLLEKNFSVSGTSFVVENLALFTFFNCSSIAGDTRMENLTTVGCLNSDNFMVAVVPTELQHKHPGPPGCRVISTALFPVSGWWMDHWGMVPSPIELTWKEPSCGDCEIGGGNCGFESDFGLQVACSNLQDHGLSRSAEYGILLTAAGVLLGVTCFMVLCYISRRGRTCGYGGGEASATSGSSDGVGTITGTTRTSNNQQPVPGTGRAGLEDPVIESYPKAQVGEAGQLPKDGRESSTMCSICLSEYKPKDTLRTIPQCRHFFHARCVDQWLRVNATCPLCRNLPQLQAR